MNKLSLSSCPPPDLDVQVLVLAASSPTARTDRTSDPEAPAPVLLTEGVDTTGLELEALPALARELGFTGALDTVLRLPAQAVGPALRARSVLLVGTGQDLERSARTEDNDLSALGADAAAVLRRAAGRAARALAGTSSAALLLPAATDEELEAVAQGALLGAYAWREGPDPAPVDRIVVTTPLADSPRAVEAVHRAEALSEAVHLVRDLVNEPPNRLTPAVFAERAVELAGQVGVGAEVLDELDLADQAFGGILGVGGGSVHPPRLVRLSWAPQDAPAGTAADLALVGKGITFDSGGLSLKPAASMPEMKSDMAGAATVLGVVLAAARLGLPVRLTGWLALAENMPGAGAQRPSDVVTMYGGTTVEIINTDAEGRLVMADALARAVEESPRALIDVATLTGAQLVALGDRVSAVMGTPGLREQVLDSARAAGEAMWPMPLPEHLRSGLDSSFADLRNLPSSRAGGMLAAGLFLREFTAGTPWAHLDIAGPAYNDASAWGLTPVGGTGAGVATLLELLRRRG
ncbi:leucyl aminopeptidase [Actinomyces howellii]|uniref:Probable cytosol aminopeptidase n=1 Tax=Actinomyces howellii TaxID=52771 RepID=A0A448HDE9_9ACTO|nr:leucyl aminopeptidase [Actinomyces howellii]VEG25846.1 Cytosol aminopeptidase [Actinomyces howellii]